MAKTKRSKKRSTKTRSKSSKSHRIDSSLLLAVLDELNELAGLLRCVPELNILSDSFRGREGEWGDAMEENDIDHDRIATAATEHSLGDSRSSRESTGTTLLGRFDLSDTAGSVVRVPVA